MPDAPWAANMSYEGVRPAEALSTDSAIVGLAVLVSWLVHFNCLEQVSTKLHDQQAYY